MDPNSNSKKIVTRFAPSPTGFMHIGSVRTALFAYLFARQNNGTFILRIEDTDKNREVSGSIEHIKETLKWLELDYDYGPDNPGTFGSCLQSERLPIYRKYAETLLAQGLAYPDPYSEEELTAFRKQAEIENKPFLFRNHRPKVFSTWEGTKPLRLKVPEIKRYTWTDAVRGELTAGEEMVDDVVLIKSDGFPTYNFAHIIDDFEMGVTHIMRADEFISSTPKFLSIYDALGFTYPTFVTLPPILRDDRKKKLGKRDGAKDILEYRNEGYLPPAMINFLAMIGWNPGTDQEIFTKDELIFNFKIEQIQKSGGAFNEDKLLWINKKHLLTLSSEEQLLYVKKYLPERFSKATQYSEERLVRLTPTIIERIQVAVDLTVDIEAGEYDFVFLTPSYDPALLQWKDNPDKQATLSRLKTIIDLLSKLEDWSSPENIKNTLWSYAETEGKGEVLWPLRIALSGKKQSPDPFTLSYILGKEEVLLRIKLACDRILE